MIVIGTTLAPYKMSDPREGLLWLANARQLVEDAGENGHSVKFFLALELDSRGLKPCQSVVSVLNSLDAETDVWTFSVSNGVEEISTDERIFRITTGRNMITEYAMREKASWIFHVDSDLRPDPETFSKLLDVGWPVVGGEVPGYCLHGPAVENRRNFMEVANPNNRHIEELVLGFGDDSETYPYPVESHWNTAGYLLVHRSVFRQIRWRHDFGRDLTDDPAWGEDVKNWLGVDTLVRKDCVGWHRGLVPVEYRGHDLKIY
jgi:hypothetical protein